MFTAFDEVLTINKTVTWHSLHIINYTAFLHSHCAIYSLGKYICMASQLTDYCHTTYRWEPACEFSSGERKNRLWKGKHQVICHPTQSLCLWQVTWFYCCCTHHNMPSYRGIRLCLWCFVGGCRAVYAVDGILVYSELGPFILETGIVSVVPLRLTDSLHFVIPDKCPQ